MTQASAGFVTSVTELVVGFMVDLSRRVTQHAVSYHSGKVPQAVMGRELRGSTLGVIGYGAIGKEVVRVAEALGMRVLICDPYVADANTVPMETLLSESDYVVPLAVATATRSFTKSRMNAMARSRNRSPPSSPTRSRIRLGPWGRR